MELFKYMDVKGNCIIHTLYMNPVPVKYLNKSRVSFWRFV